jgi:uncharacterized protein YecE (DUF72 family)
MPPVKPRLTLEEWRQRRKERREKQRADNLRRAGKMHTLRTSGTVARRPSQRASPSSTNYFIGCSGWFYWKWRGAFYPADLPTKDWFDYYAKRFDTVEINASFYAWPTPANVTAWARAASRRKFVYSVKVCELVTHIKRFARTSSLVKDFGVVADLLHEHMGCFLYQLPPSYHYSPARLKSILRQLDPERRNVVEFRHASWWRENVFAAFRETGTIFCSCSAPRLPDALIKTADGIYIRLHGPDRWYRHDYSDTELRQWKVRIEASGAKRAWIYFNNDYAAFAPKNAQKLRRLVSPRRNRKGLTFERR